MSELVIANKPVTLATVIYDEWFFGKYYPQSPVESFTLSIDAALFIAKMAPLYHELIQDLQQDDQNSGENFFLKVYGRPEYPSFDKLLLGCDNDDNMDFVNTFFIRAIFEQFLDQSQQDKVDRQWIIRAVKSLTKVVDQIIIGGDVQPITKLDTPE